MDKHLGALYVLDINERINWVVLYFWTLTIKEEYLFELRFSLTEAELRPEVRSNILYGNISDKDIVLQMPTDMLRLEVLLKGGSYSWIEILYSE